jgi:diguanylate cyclase (GGDEF)-like protein
MIILIITIFILFVAAQVAELKKFYDSQNKRDKQLIGEIKRLEEKEENLVHDIEGLERKEAAQFLFYEVARKIAPFLNKAELFSVFAEEIKYLGLIEKVAFADLDNETNYLKFPLGPEENSQALCVKTPSKRVIEYLPHFVELLRLCVERIKLYEKIQELSIYDSLTSIYNRRYFMYRFSNEFDRAKKFKFNVSFLMIDIDYFKKVNDTYGHLVGDVILREIAALIGRSIREIDFAARFGGEEFSVVLPETDKAGAIMVAERIRSKIGNRRIKAFDESLMVSVSIGVASFPQNTLYSDVLAEVADKALYKAKAAGRNRVSWF